MNLHYGADLEYGRRGQIGNRLREVVRPAVPYIIGAASVVGGPVVAGIAGAVVKGSEMLGEAIASTAPGGSKPETNGAGPAIPRTPTYGWKPSDTSPYIDEDGRRCSHYNIRGRWTVKCFD